MADVAEVRLSADPSSASSAREFVRVHLLSHGLGHLVEDVRLVVSELATNAVRHAGCRFTVVLEVSDHAVLLSVADSSPTVPVRRLVDPWEGGGRGLALVEGLSSRWGVDATTRSKTVWASFARDGRERVPE